jgi:phage-related protein
MRLPVTPVEVLLYREGDDVPILSWLESIPMRARDDCLARLRLLEQFGHSLRRPHAEYLRDGIHELRAKREGVNYRMLYFFHGRHAVVISHGIVKQRALVPPAEIDCAVLRVRRFIADPESHTFRVGA